MQELRLVAVSEDGTYAVLVAPGRSGRFVLPIDERLRTVARGQFSRLAQYDIEVESPLRPKEIQDRIRAGETAEEIADSAGLPVDRIRRFEGPVLAEREYRSQEAQRATVRGMTETGPGPRLGDIVGQRLTDLGSPPEEAEWDSRKRPDGNWQVQLAYLIAGRMQIAEWVYDPRSKHVTPDEDHAVELCLPQSQWPPSRSAASRPTGTATVTPIGARTVSGQSRFGDQSRRHPSEAARPAAESARPAEPIHPAEPDQPETGWSPEPLRPAAGPRTPAAPEPPGLDPAGRDLTMAELTAGDASAREPSHDREPAARHLAPDPYPAAAASVPVGADTASAAEPPDRAPRQGRRGSGGRPRRASVPSWDEIMFGNSRQPE